MSLHNIITNICDKNKFNGSILISKDNEIQFCEGFGYADFNNHIRVETDTKARIASISKQITACAVLLLSEQGCLSLTDTIDRYFPTYSFASKLTIHHLLSNTGGVANFDIFGDFSAIFQENDFYDAFCKEIIFPLALRFEPGDKFEYSGSGYILLTSIIEKASKLPYHEYIKKYIFEPLKMEDSGFDFQTIEIDKKAVPYDVENGEIVQAKNIDLRIAGGGGGLYSTVLDLHKWNVSLLNHSLLSKESIEKMFTSHIKIIENTDYGYGLFLESEEKDGNVEKISYHSGGGPGVQAINVLFHSKDITLSILSNVNDKTSFYNTREDIYKLVLESGIL